MATTKRRCFLWFHNFGPWTNSEEKWTDYRDNHFFKNVQIRDCLTCGFRERREI